MEPEKVPVVPQLNTTPTGESNKETFDVLHDEGIDIVQGSGVSEDNEFSKTAPIQTPAAPEVVPVSAPTPVEKPSLTRESANLLASLQEIPQAFTPKGPLAQPLEKQYAPQVSKNPVSNTTHPLNDPSIKQIRTFKSDAEEAVKFQNVSAVDIAIAEQKKREKSTPIEYEAPRTPHTGIFIIVVLAFLVLLGGGWYYWFSTSQNVAIEKAPAITTKTLISYAKASTVTVDGDSNPLILIGSKLLQSNAGLGNVFALIPVASTTATAPLALESIFRETEIPNRLIRSLAPTYMIGVYTYDAQSPFIILKNTFFQNAFSGMLEWEKDMRSDLLPFIQVAHPNEKNSLAFSSAFEDAIISNIDVRVLKNTQGDPILMYAFADKDTIVITTNQTALKYIIDRLLVVRTIQ